MRHFRFPLFLIACCGLFCDSFAQTNITPGIATLPCGEVRVTAQAHCFEAGAQPNQCFSQQIQLHLQTGESKILPQAGKLVTVSFVPDKQVLNAVLSSWACVTASTGKQYLYFLYTCNSGDERKGACARGHGEFSALFTLDGKPLTGMTQSYSAQQKKLERKLGLSTIFEQGVAMNGVEYLQK